VFSVKFQKVHSLTYPSLSAKKTQNNLRIISKSLTIAPPFGEVFFLQTKKAQPFYLAINILARLVLKLHDFWVVSTITGTVDDDYGCRK
jgi:hypothetical protein